MSPESSTTQTTKKVCNVPNCGKPVVARRVCSSCYSAAKTSPTGRGEQVRQFWKGPREFVPQTKSTAKMDTTTRKKAGGVRKSPEDKLAGLPDHIDKTQKRHRETADAVIATTTELATGLGIAKIPYRGGFVFTNTATSKSLFLSADGRIHPVKFSVGEAL